MGSYLPSTAEERQAMLQAMGLSSVDELYDAIPSSVKLQGPLQIPEGLSEMEVRSKMEKLAGKNKVFPTVFRGAGAYRHYIPSIVKYIPAKEEFVTSYTPYQAEISQGVLQAIFEYQTDMCQLMDMPVSNASVYDGATAAAEGAAGARAVVGIDAGVAELIVPRPLLLIAEHLVGLVHLFELLLGLFVAGVQIGVVLFGLLAVRFLDLILRGALGNTQYLVVIAFFCQ